MYFRNPFAADALSLAGKNVISELKAHGYHAAWVGGAVRDMLCGRRPDDIDIVTTATPEELISIFPELKTVGACFGVNLLEYEGFGFEVATAREERNYLDGRHPNEVRYTQDLAVDVMRRDFSINALLYDPLTEEVIDHVGGVDDIRHGIIRTVGDPYQRFSEDYLRMLRAVRFASRLRFEIDADTGDAIRELAEKTAEIAPERVRVEITSMLTGGDPGRAVRLLNELGILRAVLPEVAAMDGVEQPPEFHPEGDVFTHTMIMLERMCIKDANLAWSVLLHDVGKLEAKFTDDDGRVRFFGHEGIGGEITQKVLDRLRFSLDDQTVIAGAVRDHMRFVKVDAMKSDTRRKLLGAPNFALELELNRLDCVSCHGFLRDWLLLIDEVAARNGEIALPSPLVQGRDLIAAGRKPDRRFGEVLKETYGAQLAGEVTSKSEALAFALLRF